MSPRETQKVQIRVCYLLFVIIAQKIKHNKDQCAGI